MKVADITLINPTLRVELYADYGEDLGYVAVTTDGQTVKLSTSVLNTAREQYHKLVRSMRTLDDINQATTAALQSLRTVVQDIQ